MNVCITITLFKRDWVIVVCKYVFVLRIPDALLSEMREAFARSEEFLDQSEVDPMLEQKQEALQKLEEATPEQVERVLEALGVPAICANAARGR